MSSNTKITKVRAAVAGTLLAGGLLGSTTALAEVTANVGATSNYVWRGVTQTQDSAAVQGGIDYEHASGFYLGTWTSNVDFGPGSPVGYELDLYAGYAGELGALGYDLGYIAYMYPQDTDDNFEEVYLGLSYDLVSAMVSYDPSNKDMYGALGLEFEVGAGLGLDLHVGSYMFDEGEDYMDYGLTLTKDAFAFSVTHTDIDGDDPRVFVSWTTDFDL